MVLYRQMAQRCKSIQKERPLLVAPSLKQRKIEDLLVNQGMDPVGSTSDQFAALISKDATKWAAVVRATGFKLK